MIYIPEKVNDKLQEIFNNFSIDDEIDLHRESLDYKNAFYINESLKDFESYKNMLENLSKNFLTKYHEIIYRKIIKNELGMEDFNNEINY